MNERQTALRNERMDILAAMVQDLRAKLDVANMALKELVNAADDGAWHSSGDCGIEKRTDCGLCDALQHARAAQVTINT